jgi:hypothetical protein
VRGELKDGGDGRRRERGEERRRIRREGEGRRRRTYQEKNHVRNCTRQEFL